MARNRSAAWHARELLRDRGQFWTPQWVARAMVRYVSYNAGPIYDVGVGSGAFAAAIRSVHPNWDFSRKYHGAEPDLGALQNLAELGFTKSELHGVKALDFSTVTSLGDCRSVIANPPYIRHHRLSSATKQRLRRQAASECGVLIDGRAGLHVYLLIHALHLLPEDGRLAFIVPSDVVEGIFARPLWEWIASRFCVDACVRFTPEATPFPGVDTNPVVLFIRRSAPRPHFMQAICSTEQTLAFEEWVRRNMPEGNGPEISACRYPIERALERGFGRDLDDALGDSLPLSAFASTLRGVATGCNEFFFLSSEEIRTRRLPPEYFLRAVGKTTDVQGDTLTLDDLERLDSSGRPTWLLSLPSITQERLPAALRHYLDEGQELGLPARALISQRNPWYKMEVRRPPAFLFTYLGRRSARFVRNLAGAVPLTGFICVYPHSETPDSIERLWQTISDPETLAHLKHVGKTYGGGAIKVEPKSLANLPIPMPVIRRYGLQPAIRASAEQSTLALTL
ncbi:MAG TPA: N-6 DNA methylase [Rhodanobacteraceae bacterium]|nr:N-6 DNA methylase [Rhodanobacteraceae bacterium]